MARDGLTWRKASASESNGHCVELAALPDGDVAVRNSRDPDGPQLVYTRAEMAAFRDGAKAGEFDDFLRDEDGAYIAVIIRPAADLLSTD